MAGHPQSSPRGLWAKTIIVPKSGYLRFEDYSSTNNLISANSTGLKVYGSLALSNGTKYISANSTGVKITGAVMLNNAKYVTANSTGFVWTSYTSVLPTTRVVGGFARITTAKTSRLAFHSTGTTWKYVAQTSVL